MQTTSVGASTPVATRRGVLAGTALLAAGVSLDATTAEQPDGDGDGSVESTVEQLVTESLEEHDIPGASAAVVRGGEVTMAEGYGVIERGAGQSVAATTPFRLGSLSKPVVWTAVARLAGEDALDLETPVVEYVDRDLRSWDEPVTLAQLATHTGGFEATNLGMWYPTPADTDPLPEHLDRSMPSQVRSPGERGSYSNHGVALAGQALASVAGDPFGEAMDALLLDPAGMERASFRQPLPDGIREGHAVGHDSGLTDTAFAGIGMAPAGSLSASAADMARFMQLHLAGGVVDGEQVLQPDTVATVQRRWFSHDDDIAGMGLGFVEEFHGDVRILRHAGGTPMFRSELLLIPELGFGLFLAFNSAAASEPAEEIPDEVLDELLPDPAPEGLEPDGQPARAAELEGTYRTLRTAETTHDAFPFTLLNARSVDVSVDDDGALVVDGLEGRWVERESLLFQNEETGRKLAFGAENGEVSFLYVGGTPSAFASTAWYESAAVHGLVALLAFVVLVTGQRWWSPSRDREESRREWLASTRSNPGRLAELTAYGGSLAFLLFVALTAGYFVISPRAFLVEPSLLYQSAFALPVAGAATAAVAPVVAALAWLHGDWSLRRRVHYGLVAASLLVVTGFLWYWNLIVPPTLS